LNEPISPEQTQQIVHDKVVSVEKAQENVNNAEENASSATKKTVEMEKIKGNIVKLLKEDVGICVDKIKSMEVSQRKEILEKVKQQFDILKEIRKLAGDISSTDILAQIKDKIAELQKEIKAALEVNSEIAASDGIREEVSADEEKITTMQSELEEITPEMAAALGEFEKILVEKEQILQNQTKTAESEQMIITNVHIQEAVRESEVNIKTLNAFEKFVGSLGRLNRLLTEIKTISIKTEKITTALSRVL
jgi:hypothetical protein